MAAEGGLEGVEKVLTGSVVALLDGAEREHAPRVPLAASLAELLALAPVALIDRGATAHVS